eukprot:gene44-61_t
MNELLKLAEIDPTEQRKKFPDFKAGDTINVHIKISEGKKERIQRFQGVVIQRRNPNTNGETFTVRKISEGIGVERIFPLLSPAIDKIELKQQGIVRRARLFYLQGKQGKYLHQKRRYVEQTLSNDQISAQIALTLIGGLYEVAFQAKPQELNTREIGNSALSRDLWRREIGQGEKEYSCNRALLSRQVAYGHS